MQKPKLTTEERCNIYREYKGALLRIEELKRDIAAAMTAGDDAFEQSENDTEEAYEAGNAAGWLLADELIDEERLAEVKATDRHKELLDNGFKLSDYYSCCAYGIIDRKKVKVILLDDTTLYGEIYPYVYDNAQEMYLARENGEADYDLDEGWEVKEVHFL